MSNHVDEIKSFKGKYNFLSNFYPCFVEYEGIVYPSVEHAFQAAKTLDPQMRKNFSIMRSAADAKWWGGHIKLRPDWEQVKDQVMLECVKSKFTYSSPASFQKNLKKQLLDTGDAYLEEGNQHHDMYWGTYRGKGKNMLGKILMIVRDEIRNGDLD